MQQVGRLGRARWWVPVLLGGAAGRGEDQVAGAEVKRKGGVCQLFDLSAFRLVGKLGSWEVGGCGGQWFIRRVRRAQAVVGVDGGSGAAGCGTFGRARRGAPPLLGARWDELERYGSGGRVQGAWWWCQGWVAEGRKGWLVFGLPPGKEKGAGCGRWLVWSVRVGGRRSGSGAAGGGTS